jgi:hypothetical protein
MSTLLYAARTEQREVASPGTSEDTNPPKSSTWLDAIVALVPAEVLALHAIAINAWTKTETPPDGSEDGAATIITDPGALKIAFFVLIVVAFALYWFRKKDSWDKVDAIRMLIPPAAFVVWTMAQQSTAFDAVVDDIAEGTRAFLAAVLAVLLAALAKKLADTADDKGD